MKFRNDQLVNHDVPWKGKGNEGRRWSFWRSEGANVGFGLEPNRKTWQSINITRRNTDTDTKHRDLSNTK